MINQELLVFIKSQLLKGVDKESITKELLGGGWTEEDIAEGFGLLNAKVINLTNNSNPVPPIDAETFNKGKKITYTIVSTIITIGIATGLIFGDELRLVKDILVKSIKGSKTEIVNQIKQEENIKPEIQQQETVLPEQEQNQDPILDEEKKETELIEKVENKKLSAVSVVKDTTPVRTGPINCGTEMKCFISAAKTCTPAFVEETTTLDMFGIYTQTNKTKMTLTGYDSSKKCGYVSKVISANVDYSPVIKATQEYKTGTTEERNEGLVEPNTSAKSTIGMVTKCSFTTTYLSAILAIWSKGKYSINDLAPGNCSAVDSSGKPIILYTGGSNNQKEGQVSNMGSSNAGSTYDMPYKEIDLYLNEKTIFSDKSISSSDIEFTLLEVKDDPSDVGGHNKIYKISANKISTGESKTITYYDNDFNPNHQDSVFGVIIRSVGYSYVSAMLNNGIEQTILSIQISKQ